MIYLVMLVTIVVTKIFFKIIGSVLSSIYKFICCVKEDGTIDKVLPLFSQIKDNLKSKMLTSYLINENEDYAPLIFAMEELKNKENFTSKDLSNSRRNSFSRLDLTDRKDKK